MSQAVTNRMFRRMRLSEKIIEVSTLIYHLITLSIFISVLTTVLITGIQMPDIVDDETFLASGLRIMVYSQQVETLFDDIPLSLSNRLIVVDLETWTQHVYSLNDSYAYVMMTHWWLALKLKQKRLVQPKLRVAPHKLCGVPRYLRFHVQPGIFFLRSLKHFLSQAYEVGLTEQWRQQGFRQAEQMGHINVAPYEPTMLYPLPLEFYTTFIYIYAFGILTSIVCFSLEWFYFRWTQFRNNIIIV
ncbi:uncharacterized protein LOC115483333 [Drosophila hydei]|uniref:Uncharacterized protein LOC115483333 n=1 Tax=Drosophila hydei TaxID=7224 RepID=A0A6J2SU48_DROHY|nr:uncharacterized protein LOC115483333 [Drosophila hydei]